MDPGAKIPAMLTAVVVGARRARQGIGEFVARFLHQEGVAVRAVVGTREETVTQAQKALYEKHEMSCAGYTSLEEALEQVRPDLVAICSPIEAHVAHLEAAAAAGVHCLAEKPLWWGESNDRDAVTRDLVSAFVRRDRVLGQVTQWPFTLDGFFRVHPQLAGVPVKRFEMRLSPTVRGTRMVLDSASHPLSMLYALVGAGEVESPRAQFSDAERSRVTLEFSYVHSTGAVEVVCRLAMRLNPPRPAAYAINGHAVDRGIEFPHYRLFFEGGGRRVAIEDPLELLVRDFVKRVRSGSPLDAEEVILGMRGLERLMTAAEAATRDGPAPSDHDER